MQKKIVWFDARCIKNEKKIMPLIFNLRYEYIIIKRSMFETFKKPGKIKIVVEVEKKEELAGLDSETIIMSSDVKLLEQIRDKKYKTALYQKISNQKEMDKSWQIGSQHDYLIVFIDAETNIPLELLIAKLQKKNTVLLKIVKTALDAEIAFGVMEAGSDGVALTSEDVQEILLVDKLMVKSEIGNIDVVKVKVSEVAYVGMGYRACIDTTTLLRQDEGMIIGSTSFGGILVSSETHYLPYMELRPFRVNAGAVHSYVQSADGMTLYLSELKAGSRVLCTDTKGNTRDVTVGRVKIEERPLLMIEGKVNGVTVNTIVQDDWHIRIFDGNGNPCNASSIKKGDMLSGYICDGGRHVGIKINEKIEEK